jgi:tRNA-dihydrouridine synthase 4
MTVRLVLQGCPQPWAYSEGIGSALLRQPELVADMVKQVHARMGDDFAISVKIRVDDEDHLTERLVQTGWFLLLRPGLPMKAY